MHINVTNFPQHLLAESHTIQKFVRLLSCKIYSLYIKIGIIGEMAILPKIQYNLHQKSNDILHRKLGKIPKFLWKHKLHLVTEKLHIWIRHWRYQPQIILESHSNANSMLYESCAAMAEKKHPRNKPVYLHLPKGPQTHHKWTLGKHGSRLNAWCWKLKGYLLVEEW